jgi:selenocysteine lyase/cysteine desulfurase
MVNLIEQIRASVIGDRQLVETPFGLKPLIYADYTASGRALGLIEDFIRQEVLPYYANTHSESSFCGARMTRLREEARQIVKQAVRGREQDQVIFCGSGATAGIAKLIGLLDLNERFAADLIDKPVVLIGEYEHHSNDLPWRELNVDLHVIGLDENGMLDQAEIEQVLGASSDRNLVIGSFSAASNVTGLKSEVEQITQLLNQYGALSCWDYAAAAPYVQIDMGLGGGIDAVFFSPHKFVGGPGTPGVLVVNSAVVKREIPTIPGGGTVRFVSGDRHVYSDDIIRREEAGTPDIVGSVRAGMAIKLQQTVGTELIEKLETDFTTRALARLRLHPNIHVLGNLEAARLSIISFQVGQNNSPLHYGLVVAMLNDLFGIQARGGCSCAGRYAHSLLDIDSQQSEKIEADILEGSIYGRPGWVRVNFNYFIDEATFEYILQAIVLIAENGHKLQNQYEYNETSGAFVCQVRAAPNNLTSIEDFLNKQPSGKQPLDKQLLEKISLPNQYACNEGLVQNLRQAEAILG